MTLFHDALVYLNFLLCSSSFSKRLIPKEGFKIFFQVHAILKTGLLDHLMACTKKQLKENCFLVATCPSECDGDFA